MVSYLQMLPKPTAYPMQAKRNEILLPQVSLASSPMLLRCCLNCCGHNCHRQSQLSQSYEKESSAKSHTRREKIEERVSHRKN